MNETEMMDDEEFFPFPAVVVDTAPAAVVADVAPETGVADVEPETVAEVADEGLVVVVVNGLVPLLQPISTQNPIQSTSCSQEAPGPPQTPLTQ